MKHVSEVFNPKDRTEVAIIAVLADGLRGGASSNNNKMSGDFTILVPGAPPNSSEGTVVQ